MDVDVKKAGKEILSDSVLAALKASELTGDGRLKAGLEKVSTILGQGLFLRGCENDITAADVVERFNAALEAAVGNGMAEKVALIDEMIINLALEPRIRNYSILNSFLVHHKARIVTAGTVEIRQSAPAMRAPVSQGA